MIIGLAQSGGGGLSQILSFYSGTSHELITTAVVPLSGKCSAVEVSPTVVAVKM